MLSASRRLTSRANSLTLKPRGVTRVNLPTQVNVVKSGVNDLSVRGFSSWFNSANNSPSFEQLTTEGDKLNYVRRMVQSDPRMGLSLIEQGWAAGKLPTTEQFAKEYCKAAFALKRFDNVDLNALSLMLHNELTAGIQSSNGGMTAAQMQQLLAASLSRSSGGSLGSGAGESADRPIFVANKSSSFKDQMWKLLGMGVSTFIVLAFLSTLFDPKAVASKMGISGPSSTIKKAEQSDKTFDDVVGVEEAKSELEEIVMYLKDPKRFTRLGGKLPKGVLLTGPPGTGKTLLAKAIAGEAEVPFFYSSGSEFEEMYVGVGARRVRDLFAAANANAPCIIFIDEIDAVGGSRNLKDQTAMKMTLNQLLVEMDGFQENNGVIVIGATNFADALDSALTRPGRLDRHIEVPLPDVGGRKDILELYSKKMPLSAEVDLEQIARGTPGYSGAELFNLMNQAAVKSSVMGLNAISMKMLEWAKDRISMGAERQSAILSEETMKLTAHHEAGHALVGILTEGSDPIHKATIIPRGRALGLVLQLPDGDQTSMSLKQMMARLDVCMAGRIAEEIMFGHENVTSGASSDIQQATRLARAMVTKYGFSEKIGSVFINNDPSQNDRGTSISDETLKEIDGEIKRLCDESYARTLKLLTENKQKLINIAEGLIKYETLAGAEVVEIANTGKLAADGTNGSIRSQKPSRELKQIPSVGVGGPKKPLFPPAPPGAGTATPRAPKPKPKPDVAPALQNKLNPPSSNNNNSTGATADSATSNPLSGLAAWFGGAAAGAGGAKDDKVSSSSTFSPPGPSNKAAHTQQQQQEQQSPVVVSRAPTSVQRSHMHSGQSSTSTEIRVRNINGKIVEESTTTVVSKDPETGKVSKTITRRIRGPPVIVGQQQQEQQQTTKSAAASSVEKEQEEREEKNVKK